MDKNKVKLGIAPIAWTNDDLPDLGGENTFQQCISEMALAGYTGSEVGNKYPKDTEVLKKALKLRGMEICNAWFSACFTSKPYDEVIKEFIEHRDFMVTMGAKVIGGAEIGNSVQGIQKPVIDAKPNFTEEQWSTVIKGLNEITDLAAEKGIKFAIHHHMGTGIQTPAEIDRIMEACPKLSLLFDSGHLVYSEDSQDKALEVLKKYINRIAHVHLKDVRPAVIEKVKKEKLSFLDGVRAGTFTVPGNGVIDFVPIFKILDDANYEGYMVVEAEQDPAIANPFEYALIARKYIQDKTGL